MGGGPPESLPLDRELLLGEGLLVSPGTEIHRLLFDAESSLETINTQTTEMDLAGRIYLCVCMHMGTYICATNITKGKKVSKLRGRHGRSLREGSKEGLEREMI